jgi:hypothetical protein
VTTQWTRNRYHERDPWRFDLQTVLSTTVAF